MIITVEIKQGFADRPFGFHVKTLEQQAKQGLIGTTILLTLTGSTYSNVVWEAYRVPWLELG